MDDLKKFATLSIRRNYLIKELTEVEGELHRLLDKAPRNETIVVVEGAAFIVSRESSGYVRHSSSGSPVIPVLTPTATLTVDVD